MTAHCGTLLRAIVGLSTVLFGIISPSVADAQSCAGVSITGDLGCATSITSRITPSDDNDWEGYTCQSGVVGDLGPRPDRTYTFVCDGTGSVRIQMTMDCELDLRVFHPTCDPVNDCVAASTEGLTPLSEGAEIIPEDLTFSCIPNETFYVVIEGFGMRGTPDVFLPGPPLSNLKNVNCDPMNEGNFTLWVSAGASLGCGEDCDDGADNDSDSAIDCPDGDCASFPGCEMSCSGCRSGGSCLPGDSPVACGTGGSACLACDDADPCTEDLCGSGACVHPPDSGAPCDDELYCTVDDACTGAGTCGSSPRVCADDGLLCTTEACNEAADRCDSEIAAGFCLIDGACVALGAQNPSNPCQVCDPSRSVVGWSPAASGTSCNDGAFCTVDDRCDGAGTCTGAARPCDDSRACTADRCDESIDDCTNELRLGSCLIDGACVTGGAVNPANECEACDPTVSTGAYSNRPSGTTCDDGAFCTIDDRCTGAGACAGSSRSCDDGIACTTDLCDEAMGRCENTVGTTCLISGTCYAAGVANPANPCEVCDPSVSSTTFTALAPGADCDDGRFCTDGDVCSATGTCAGTARRCDDGLSCTTDACDESADACTATVSTGCLIAGGCVSSGAPSPTNPCLSCDPAMSPLAYTARDAGAGCDDGLYCTEGDACDGLGTCTGAARSCDDGLSCTADSCDEGAMVCAAAVAAGFCLIEGVCYGDGDASPGAACLACVSSVAARAFSPRPEGTRCGEPSCQGGVVTRAPLCDAVGTCTPGETAPCFSGECADENTCEGPCTSDADCLSAEHCDAEGICAPDLPDGEPCERDAMCESDLCSSEVCASEPIDRDGGLPDAGDDAGLVDGGGDDGGSTDGGELDSATGPGEADGSVDAAADDSGRSVELEVLGSSCLCRAPGSAPRSPGRVELSFTLLYSALFAIAVRARRRRRTRRRTQRFIEGKRVPAFEKLRDAARRTLA